MSYNIKTTLFFLPALFLSLLANSSATAQSLYTSGKSLKDQAISVEYFGGGYLGETDEKISERKPLLRLTSHNYHNGGALTFQNPIDLSSQSKEPNSLLVITLKYADLDLILGKDQETATAPSSDKFQNLEKSWLRVGLETTDQKYAELYIPLGTNSTFYNGWQKIGVALAKISGLLGTNQHVKKMTFTFNKMTTVYISDIQITTENAPILSKIENSDLNLALGDTIQLIGKASGGMSPLEYHWNFDDQKSRAFDARGRTIEHTFRARGLYTVRLTVTDSNGLKPAHSSTIKVTVNP